MKQGKIGRPKPPDRRKGVCFIPKEKPRWANTGAPQGRRLSIQDFKRAQETEDVQVSAKKVERLFEPKLVDLFFAKNPASEPVGLDGQGGTKDITRHISEKLEDEAFFFHLRHVLTSFRKGGGESGRRQGDFNTGGGRPSTETGEVSGVEKRMARLERQWREQGKIIRELYMAVERLGLATALLAVMNVVTLLIAINRG